jgi:DNA-binding beta-propeller fold protein YncE
MKRFVPIIMLALLNACGGGGGAGLPLGQDATAASPMSEAQSHTTSLTPVPYSADELYVSNAGNNTITVYHHDAQGNAAPIWTIAGQNTGLENPGQLSEDAQGNLYVVNGGASILVFAFHAHGNVKPLRVLHGPATGLRLPAAVTVDQSTGKIFVADNGYEHEAQPGILLRFPPNASGNQAPFAAGQMTFETYQIASDSTGNNIIEAHVEGVSGVIGVDAGVDTYAKQFYAGQNPAEPYSVRYIDAIHVFTAAATGNAQPLRVLSGLATQLRQPVGIYEGK